MVAVARERPGLLHQRARLRDRIGLRRQHLVIAERIGDDARHVGQLGPEIDVRLGEARQHTGIGIDLDALGVVVAADRIVVAEGSLAAAQQQVAARRQAGRAADPVARVIVVVDDREDLAEAVGRADCGRRLHGHQHAFEAFVE